MPKKGWLGQFADLRGAWQEGRWWFITQCTLSSLQWGINHHLPSYHIKFARYNIRNRVFKNNKKLKDTGVSITKSLTQKQMQMLTKTRNEFLFKNVWTHDGKILVKSDDNTIKVYYE